MVSEPLETRRIVIIGAGGRLGAALARAYRTDFGVVGFNHSQLDLADAGAMRETLGAIEFDLLINAAAQTNVDRCESQRDEAFELNAEAPGVLAKICSGKNAKLIHISTDYVFDGDGTKPYVETDQARPISVYGESKRAGEERVLEVSDRHLVVRVSWVFGPDRPSFIDGVIARAREHETVEAIADKFAAPTYTLDLAVMLRPFLPVTGGVDRGHKPEAGGTPVYSAGDVSGSASGIIHLANSGECSWQEYGQWALDCCHEAGVRLKARTVGAVSMREMKNFVAKRPSYSVLGTAKFEQITGEKPRPWRDAVRDYVRSFVKD